MYCDHTLFVFFFALENYNISLCDRLHAIVKKGKTINVVHSLLCEQTTENTICYARRIYVFYAQ